MKMIVISGRSGSGKSTMLRALEDEGVNCIDNFPVSLLHDLVRQSAQRVPAVDLAVCIDARSPREELQLLPDVIATIRDEGTQLILVFLNANSAALVKRFSDTRRRHPLAGERSSLHEAINEETQILEPIAELADLRIDTTNLRASELVELLTKQLARKSEQGLALLIRSFGYKFGVPVDADFVFDLRALPNPFWVEELRPLSGLDTQVEEFFDGNPIVESMFTHVREYLEYWLPQFERQQRIYVTVAFGCTGGQHRSVYMAKRIAEHFRSSYPDLLLRHRELTAESK